VTGRIKWIYARKERKGMSGRKGNNLRKERIYMKNAKKIMKEKEIGGKNEIKCTKNEVQRRK
jgi:hypothetical protein